MNRPQTIRTVLLLIVAFGAVVPALTGGAEALNLRVQARSELTVDVQTAGTYLFVTGQLRDDLGQPLPGRQVQVVADSFEPDGDRQTVKVSANHEGRYRAQFRLSPGNYRVRARFQPTPHLTGATREAEVQLRPRPVSLEIDAPALVRPGRAPVYLRVKGSVEGTGSPLQVRLRVEEGGETSVRLDRTGRARVEVSDMLSPGRNRIVAQAVDAPTDESSAGETSLWLTDDVEIEADSESVFERFQRGVAVEGTVRARGAPVGGATVRVKIRPKRPETRPETRTNGVGDEERSSTLSKRVETDGSGSFRALFSRSDLRQGKWRARVTVVPDVGEPWSREAGVFEIDRTLSRIITGVALALALLALVVLVGREIWRVIRRKWEEYERERERTERRRQAFEEEQELEPVSIDPDLVGDDETADEFRVRGQIWDGWREAPVEDASVELRREDGDETVETKRVGSDGIFALTELDSGRWTLVVEADFYMRGRFDFAVPHSGALDPCRFEVVPIPLKIRELYQSLVELAAGDDLWGELSPREIRETIRDVLAEVDPAPTPETGGESRPFSAKIRSIASGEAGDLETARDYLEALTDLVEETYFGPRRYGRDTWQVAREVALELKRAVETAQPDG